MTNSGLIPVPFQRNLGISADSGAILADSDAIPAELLDSRWNPWGTVKYWAMPTSLWKGEGRLGLDPR